jgi:hypothetical protein
MPNARYSGFGEPTPLVVMIFDPYHREKWFGTWDSIMSGLRRFSAAKTCSTRLCTRPRVALPRAMCGGTGRRRGLERWNCVTRLRFSSSIRLAAAIGGVRPDLTRRVRRIEHAGELAAVVTGGVADHESPDKTVPAVDADVVLVAEHRDSRAGGSVSLVHS